MNYNESERNSIPWYEAYGYLAEQLNQFYKQFLNNAGTKLFELCNNDTAFTKNNKWVQKFSLEWGTTSLDPLHVFASISGNSSNPKQRTERIAILIRLLEEFLYTSFYDGANISNAYLQIDFTGCPAVMPLKILSAREPDSQMEIWALFNRTYEAGKEGIEHDIFSQAKDWYGVSGKIITILLFWIRPNAFLPLDKNTLSLLQQHQKIDRFPKTVDEYKHLLVGESNSLYKNITLLSYNHESYETLNEHDKREYISYLNLDGTLTSPSTRLEKWVNKCKLIAIKPLPDCNPKFLKSLKVNELYKLYQNFHINEDGIEYISDQDFGLYDVDELKINISAIVGKNGTGKSTLIELFIIALNNLAHKRLGRETNSPVLLVKDINLEFFFETNRLYKVIMRNTDVSIVAYEKIDDTLYNEFSVDDIRDFEFDNLFYATLINYSLHGLNSEAYGNWLEKLFHKNDGYQTPIVIEPLRTKGIIDVNRQDLLVKQRLLVNLLELEDSDNDSFSLRYLKKDIKAQHLKLTLNHSKYLTNTEENIQKANENSLSIETKVAAIESIFDMFEVQDVNILDFESSNKEIINIAECYLVKKLLKITTQYPTYSEYYKDGSNSFLDLRGFIAKLKQDNSHVTYKLRQAIYFLKFNVYPIDEWDNINIERTSNKLSKILSEMQVTEPLARLDYLLPPSFFNIEIYLNNEIEFSGLSSGEKQKIYSINSILYHLKNIDSVTGNIEGSYKYNYVNIFLDEIELCFHPELQRTFIHDLRKSLEKCFPSNVYGINICFVTHSPFVLSDIPAQNILFLDMDKTSLSTIPFNNDGGTFAANIHDLLTDGFFMDSSIGAFAESVITDIVNLHNNVLNSIDIDGCRSEYLLKQQKFKFVADAIADDYIQGVISNHLIEIEKELGVEKPIDIDNEISVLEKKLAELKLEKENYVSD